MTRKQTSPSVSSIAGKYVRMTNRKMEAIACGPWAPTSESRSAQRAFFRDIRKLAASCLAQDETKGQGR